MIPRSLWHRIPRSTLRIRALMILLSCHDCSLFYSSWIPIKLLVKARVTTLVPYPATRNFRRWRKITDFTNLRVVGYCVGWAIFVPLFLVVIAAAAAIVTVVVIAAVVALLLVVIVANVSPPIVVFGEALLRVGNFRRYRFQLLVPSIIFRCMINPSQSSSADNTRRRTAARSRTGSNFSV